MDAGILPVKSPTRAKQRLAPDFSPSERHNIALALFEDALDLCESSGFLDWWVVSDDADVLQVAADRGLDTVRDRGAGLNAAIEMAVSVVLEAGATSVTTIPSDVPLAWRGDLMDLIDTGATSDVVVVPSQRDGGTNALYLSPPDLMEPRFGDGSLSRHMALAEEKALRCALLPLPRLALDIDTVDDVREFLSRPQPSPGRTAQVLSEIRIAAAD
jgi:2-phospho-L-lactate/phosphoenolpyruvate guanylyltransferase